MRLLVISHYFWPEDYRVNELVLELTKRGHAITVLTGKPNYPGGKIFPEFLENPSRFSTFHGVRLIRVPVIPRGRRKFTLVLNYLSAAFAATVVGLFRLRKETFDAIFVFAPSPATTGIPALVLRSLKGWPMAIWVLDQWPETLSAVGVVKSKRLLAIIGRCIAFMYERSALILASSKGIAAMIGNYCRDPDRIAYFPNWVEAVYHRDAETAAAEVPVQTGVFTVMFAGNIGEAQNFPVILDAAEQLMGNHEIRWVILGDGRMADWVREAVKRRGLEGKFILLGRYPPERMASFFKHADALLVALKPDPVFAMTVPGKVQSYLAAGLPILGSLNGEGAALIAEAKAGFVCPAGDSKKLAEIVHKMARMKKQERLQMGENGRAYACREFDREVLVNRLNNLLTSVVEAGCKSGS